MCLFTPATVTKCLVMERKDAAFPQPRRGGGCKHNRILHCDGRDKSRRAALNPNSILIEYFSMRRKDWDCLQGVMLDLGLKGGGALSVWRNGGVVKGRALPAGECL